MTPAIQELQAAGCAYTLHSYSHDSRSRSYGHEAAQKLNVAPQQVFKTLVVDSGKDLYVAIVSVANTLNLKRMAKATGCKKLSLIKPNRLQASTGYIIGGVSPLGQKRRLFTVLDDTAFNFETIYISAGKRGMDVEIAPSDLRELTNAVIGKIRVT